MRSITRNELKQMNEVEHSDFVLINVLAPEAFNQQHIRTSVNVPLESTDFPAEVERIAGSKERDIVVYCANFSCDASPKAAKQLEMAGFTHIYDYTGGTQDWFDAKQSA